MPFEMLCLSVKIDNKLRIFFCQVGHTISKAVLAAHFTDLDISCCEQLQKSDAIGDAAKQTSAVPLDQTAKGRKIATWATGRHHNSHPQLPSTRPKKGLPDRGEYCGIGH